MPETRIADSVHGTVVLTEHEAAVVSSSAFQRLRGIKHLGLAALVFPGADYSRLSHGVGTLHITGLTLEALNHHVPGSVDDHDRRLYRMAALLHDVGHYPFSHTFERALKNFYSGENIIQREGETVEGEEPLPEIWLHEQMGKEILARDEELRSLVEAADLDPLAVARVIERVDPPKFTNLISSDLDADRMDYLMRTARHTGLPYGNVDLPYLLTQISLDHENRICFRQKGLRAVEHLLLCRYFDYQQVSFNKTVAGLELVLNDAVEVLLRRGLLDCSSENLGRMVENGAWCDFDDAAVISRMREALQSDDLEDRERLLVESVLRRRPPKLIASRERLGREEVAENFRDLETLARSKKAAWEDEFGVPFYLWTQRGTSLTKIASSVPVSTLADINEEDFDKVEQAVRILQADGSSRPIQENRRSLISVLSDEGLFTLRVYALLGPDSVALRDPIHERVRDDLGPFWLE